MTMSGSSVSYEQLAKEEVKRVAYTCEDAVAEVGDSTDMLLGLRASMKKWEQIVNGNEDSYGMSVNCGVCFVMHNRGETCYECREYFDCIYVDRCTFFVKDRLPYQILAALQEAYEMERYKKEELMKTIPVPEGAKMPYTKEDARREVGDSTDLIVGLEVSVKKWQQIVDEREKGEVLWDDQPYQGGQSCGVCFVVINITHSLGVCEYCHTRFGIEHKVGVCHFLSPEGAKAILQHLKDTLQHERWHIGMTQVMRRNDVGGAFPDNA